MPRKPEWVEVTHAKHGGTVRVPNKPHVLADFARRGWSPPKPAVSGSDKKE